LAVVVPGRGRQAGIAQYNIVTARPLASPAVARASAVRPVLEKVQASASELLSVSPLLFLPV
jgi:hypothetical protein